MNIRDLKYLLALAEHRHFGKAADACSVSQPTLSTQIKKLEKELEIALVERDNKNVMLTETGEAIAERAQSVLADIEEIRNMARQATDPACGSLTLGVIPTVCPYLMPYAVKAIKKHFPSLKLYLHEAQTHVLTEILKSGSIDAAIMALPIDDDRIEPYPVYAESFFAALPVGHPLSKHKTISAREFQNEEMLLLEDGHCLRDQALEVCANVGATEMRGFRATSLETLRQMVVSGVGVTLLPTLAAEANMHEGSDIHIVPFDDPRPFREVGIFYRVPSPRKALFRQLGEAIAHSLPRGLKQDLRIITPTQ